MMRTTVWTATVLMAIIAMVGCGDTSQVTAGADPGTESNAGVGISVPDGARSAHTGEEFCGTDTENTPIEMAFNGTVRAIEFVDPSGGADPDQDADADQDTDADPSLLPWVTFDVDAWYTQDLGTEIALWGRNFDVEPGQRWLIAASRYSVGQIPSGDVFWCASEPESPDALATWDAEYGGSVEPGGQRPENPPPPELVAEIEAARARWMAEAPLDYTATIMIDEGHGGRPGGEAVDGAIDACPANRARIVVEDGQIVEALNVYEDCELDPSTVPTMLDLFDVALAAAGAVEYSIGYDPDYGYVDSIGAFDRGVSVSAGVQNFVPEARPMTSAADASTFDAALENARATWLDSGITSYTVTIDNLCFCGFGGPARVTVTDGEVVDVQTEGGNVDELTGDLGFVITVDDAFRLIDDARDADRLHVAYHPELGYPVDIDIDYITNAVDDELQVLILNLEPQP